MDQGKMGQEDDTELDYIPEYLSDEVKGRLRALAKESEPIPLAVIPNEYQVRHWCEALEDGNPLYLDEDYARGESFKTLVTPPGMLVMNPLRDFRWPWPPKVLAVETPVKELLGLPVGIVSDTEVEFFKSVEIGEQLTTSSKLVSISPWKKTRVGEGHFVTSYQIIRNSAGEMVARIALVLFYYGRGAGGPQTFAKGGWSSAVEEAMDGERTGYQPPAPRNLHWEDVEEGQELPKLVMPINATRLVYAASATRDFSPQHSNRDYAQNRSKKQDMFVNSPFTLGILSRYMTDWGGPKSRVRAIKYSMRDSVYCGEDMVVTGRVTRKYEKDGEHLVDLDVLILAGERPATPTKGTIALPSRGS